MGILARFSEIMKANINALLDKCEDPAKMIDQTLRDLRVDLADVRRETAAVAADRAALERRVTELKEDMSAYTVAAQNAVKAGNDNDARELIAKKQRCATNLTEQEQALDIARTNEDKMRQMHNKLASDIEALEARKDTIKAKLAAAKAQEKMNKMVSGDAGRTSIESFERMEAKANKALDAAMAAADLSQDTGTDNLLKKYGSGGSMEVEDELAAMKASLGMGAATN